jgi:hypothetical protein
MARHQPFPFRANRCKAFDAPVLCNVNSNLRGRRIADEIGNAPIRYGAVRIAIGQSDRVQHTDDRMVFADPKILG